MGTGKIANLSVGVSLDAAEFTQGLTKAQAQAQKFSDDLAGSMKAAGAVLAGVFSVNAFANLVTGAIDAADHLNDLSKKTGIAVDTLGGIGFAAGQAGGDLESASAAAGKLNKSLAEAAAGNEKAAEAFKLMGISVKDAEGNTKTADRALSEIADKFAGYADGPEKAALALRIFGKAGADIIPLLDDGGAALQENIDYYKRFSGVTQDVADASDKFNDTLGKVNLLSKSFGTTLAAALLPMLQAVADEILNAKEKSDLFKNAASALRVVLETLIVTGATVKDVFVGVGDSLGAYAAVSARLLQGDLAGAKEIGQAYREAAEERAKALDQFTGRVMAQPKAASTDPADFAAMDFSSPKSTRKPPRLSGDADGGAKDDPAKKLLENHLKRIEAGVKREQELLATRNKFLDLFDGESLMSVRDYYAAKQNAQDMALAAEIAGYDAQVEALRKYQQQATKATDRAGAQGKIEAALEKRAELERRGGEVSIENTQRQRKATEDYETSLSALNAQVLEVQGNLQAAAAIRFDLANVGLAKRFTAEGNADAERALKILREYAVAQAQYTKLSNDSGQALDQLKLQEDRIAIGRQVGATSELESLMQIGAARQAALLQMDAIVAAEEAIATASGNPALILNAEKARVALEQLRATADPLGDKLKGIFSDSLGDAFVGFIEGTKSASEAFRDFASSVISQLVRMAAQQAASGLVNGILGAFAGSAGGGAGGNPYKTWIDGGQAVASFAVGTNNIPYDNYPAMLHKGEAVVPAKYNPAVGGMGAGMKFDFSGQTFNIGQGVSRGEVQAAVMAGNAQTEAKIRRSLRQERGA